MLQGDLRSFIAYFEEWAENHDTLKFFVFGSVEKGMDYARGFEDFAYPLAWLEAPNIVPDENETGNVNDVFNGGISILVHAPLDDKAAQIEAQALALDVLYSLRKKIRHDLHNGLIEYEYNKMRLDPVLQIWNESHYGYRLEMEIAFNVNHLIC